MKYKLELAMLILVELLEPEYIKVMMVVKIGFTKIPEWEIWWLPRY